MRAAERQWRRDAKPEADALIGLCSGAENVFSAHTGYKAVSLEATAAAAPDAIGMMDSHTR